MEKVKMYNLFLDSTKTPKDVSLYNNSDSRYVNLEWIIVKNFMEFVNEIADRYLDNELPNVISFDNYLIDDDVEDMTNPDYNSFGDRTGYHCARWLLDFCIDKDIKLPTYLLHSIKESETINILHLLQSYECGYCGGEGYHKMSCAYNTITNEKS